jgi:hypothetical protein
MGEQLLASQEGVLGCVQLVDLFLSSYEILSFFFFALFVTSLHLRFFLCLALFLFVILFVCWFLLLFFIYLFACFLDLWVPLTL